MPRALSILCAGSIGSTQILHRSGSGPPTGWRRSEFTPCWTGKASDLICRTTCTRPTRSKGSHPQRNLLLSLFRRGLMGLDYAFRRRGPLTMAPSQLGIFTRSDPRRDRANIQFHVQPLSLDKFGDPLNRFPAITVSACNLQPTSRGTCAHSLGSLG